MGSIVRFVGKDYEIPEQLDNYIDLLGFFNGVRDSLISFFLKSINSELKTSDPSIVVDMNPIFEQYASQVIQMLCDNGVYNKTTSDYLKNNGYQLYDEAWRDMGSKQIEFLMDSYNSLMEGVSYAQDKAASNITGTGIRVFSSSFLTLAASSAFEMSVLKRQANEADAQYRKEISSISDRIDDTRKRKEINYARNTYMPKSETAISVFAFALMDQFISDLIDNKKFDQIVLQYVNFQRSQELLANLLLSSNKTAVLEAAFLACPFNEVLYEKCAEHGLLDVETLRTAMKYCPENKAAQGVVENCTIKNNHSNYSDEYARIKPNLPIISMVLQESESSVIKSLFKQPYEYCVDRLNYYKNISEMADKAAVRLFVAATVARESPDLYTKTPDIIKQNVQTVVFRELNSDNIAFLKTIGYFPDLDANQLLIEQLVESTTSSVINYISECKSERNKLDLAKYEFEKTVQEKGYAIAKLEQELSSLGVFAGSKKKELRQRIEAAVADKENYSKNANYHQHEAHFKAMYI